VNLVGEGIGADTHVIHVETVPGLDLVETLAQREVGAAESKEANFRGSVLDDDRAGTSLRAFSNLRSSLSITSTYSSASRCIRRRRCVPIRGEIGGLGVTRPRQGTPADGIAVHIAIAGKSAQPVESSAVRTLRDPGLLRIDKRIGHPVVHAQVKIGEHKDRGLQALSQIESSIAQFKALLDRAGEQNDVLGIAVGQKRGEEQVGLRGARRHARGRAGALHVEDDAGNLSIVARPENSVMSERPGPEVAVMERAPAQPAPSTMRWRPVRLQPAPRQMWPCLQGDAEFLEQVSGGFDDEVEGVMGYHATTVTPANTAPMPQPRCRR